MFWNISSSDNASTAGEIQKINLEKRSLNSACLQTRALPHNEECLSGAFARANIDQDEFKSSLAVLLPVGLRGRRASAKFRYRRDVASEGIFVDVVRASARCRPRKIDQRCARFGEGPEFRLSRRRVASVHDVADEEWAR